MAKCPVCGESSPGGTRGRSLQSAYEVSALVTELKVIRSNPGPEGAQAARDVPIGESLASELHAWGHGLPGATEPDRSFVDEWIAAVDYLTNEAFRP